MQELDNAQSMMREKVEATDGFSVISERFSNVEPPVAWALGLSL